jgi:integrase
MTVTELLEEYIEDRVRLGRSPATLRNYRQQAKYIGLMAFGSEDIAHLTGRAIDKFYGFMQAQGKGNTYIRRIHSLLTAAFKWGVRKDMLEVNPCDKADAPAEPKHRVHAPLTDQVQQIIDASSPKWGLMWRVAATTGMRRGELCGLRWSDIDAFSNTITVRQSVTRGGVPGPTKTHTEREVPVSPELLARLQSAQEAGQLAKAEYIFADNPNSGPCSPDKVTREFANVTRKLGITGVTPHTLRHWAGTQMVASGVPIKVVSERLGHSDPSITLRIYTDVLAEQARAAGDTLEGKLR